MKTHLDPTGLAQLGPTQIGVSRLGGAQLGSHHEPSWGPAGAHMGMLAGIAVMVTEMLEVFVRILPTSISHLSHSLSASSALCRNADGGMSVA